MQAIRTQLNTNYSEELCFLLELSIGDDHYRFTHDYPNVTFEDNIYDHRQFIVTRDTNGAGLGISLQVRIDDTDLFMSDFLNTVITSNNRPMVRYTILSGTITIFQEEYVINNTLISTNQALEVTCTSQFDDNAQFPLEDISEQLFTVVASTQ